MPQFCKHLYPSGNQCATRAHFGPLGGKPIRCKEHSLGYVNLSAKICQWIDEETNQKCNRQASFGVSEDGKSLRKVIRWCSYHRDPVAVNLISRHCVWRDPDTGERCTKVAHFGGTDLKKEWCFPHSNKELHSNIDAQLCQWIDPETDQKCHFTASFGVDGVKRWCSQHQTKGRDVNLRARICTFVDPDTHVACSIYASYGDGGINFTRCAQHRLPEQRMHASVYCSVCLYFTANGRADGKCRTCSPSESEARTEIVLVQLLRQFEVLGRFIHDRPLDGQVPLNLPRRRPDIRFEDFAFEQAVIVENDEHAHVGYTAACEMTRMHEIAEAMDRPILFIRYNPHSRGHSSSSSSLSDLSSHWNQERLSAVQDSHLPSGVILIELLLHLYSIKTFDEYDAHRFRQVVVLGGGAIRVMYIGYPKQRVEDLWAGMKETYNQYTSSGLSPSHMVDELVDQHEKKHSTKASQPNTLAPITMKTTSTNKAAAQSVSTASSSSSSFDPATAEKKKTAHAPAPKTSHTLAPITMKTTSTNKVAAQSVSTASSSSSFDPATAEKKKTAPAPAPKTSTTSTLKQLLLYTTSPSSSSSSSSSFDPATAEKKKTAPAPAPKTSTTSTHPKRVKYAADYYELKRKQDFKGKGMKEKEKRQIIKAEWHAMSAEQKQPYQHKSDMDKLRFHTEVGEFHEQEKVRPQRYRAPKRRIPNTPPSPTLPTNTIPSAKKHKTNDSSS